MKNDIFPDWLPPALVKDLRQMLRSPLYVLALLGLLGVFTLMMLRQSEGAYVFAAMLLCAVVPARVSVTVAADVRAGANFMRLTPLSSWQLVRGTWASAMVQVVLLALLLLPSVALSVPDDGAGAVRHWVKFCYIVSCMVIVASVLVALAQATAGAGAVTRLLVGFLVLQNLFVLPFLEFQVCEGQWSWQWSWLLWLLGVSAVLTVVLLAEARRLFAHPAENYSAALRLSSLLGLVVYGASLMFGARDDFPVMLCAYVAAAGLVLVVALWDALRPVVTAPLRKPGLPGLILQPGVSGGAWWLAVSGFICGAALVPLVGFQWLARQFRETEAFPPIPALGLGDLLLLLAELWVAVLVCLLAVVLVCSLVRRFRLALFVLLLGLQFIYAMKSGILLLPGEMPVNLWSFLPLFPVEISHVDLWFKDTSWNAETLATLHLLLGVKLVWLVGLLVVFARFPRK